ncbi:mfs monosaccharide [Lichtheimia corymbifera JMRC:FSU:9682]|uniref:Mfs monosaccharide n=1 Tax=Lichtheimia corymbifera JMRC:FSU:9682 TaxID=1263082 RepID=A0A068RSH1_9FUNG|nr:mfs monosaccharide [Lichtheimia corymbifera JMRC:FSU:9682]
MAVFNISDKLHGRKLIIAINVACGFSIFAFGYDQGLMAGVNNSRDYIETMNLGGNEAMRGGVVAAYYCGSLIGSFFGGYAGDKLGRIKCVILGCIWGIFGATLQTAAQNVEWMICSRIITGVATGYLNAIVPVWSAETSTPMSRGAFIAMQFTLNIFGVVVAYWLAFAMTFAPDNSVRWRFPIAFQMFPQMVLLVMVFFFPESPRWLLKHNREEQAIQVLAALRGDGDRNHPNVLHELKEIRETLRIEEAQGGEPSFYKMLFEKDEMNIPRRVHMTVWIQIMQQVTIYAPEIFRLAGFDSFVSMLVAGINNITYMISTFVAVITLDRWGRRFIMMYGAVCQAVCFIGIGVLCKPDILERNPLVEIFPLKVRARGGAWSTIGWSIGNGLVTLSTPSLFEKIGWATFILYAGFNVAVIPVVWALYPETMSKSLEELDVIFSTKAMFVKSAEKELRAKGIDPDDPLAHLRQNGENHNQETKQQVEDEKTTA